MYIHFMTNEVNKPLGSHPKTSNLIHGAFLYVSGIRRTALATIGGVSCIV